MTRHRVGAFVAVLVAASLGGWRLGEARRAETSATVTRVVDGDTIDVVVGGRRETVRLLGVDTPETVAPDRPIQCFGPEASAHTHARLEGRRVRLEYDAQRRDRYGRLLAYVLLDGRRYNDELVRLGFARLLVILPNGLHGRELLGEEIEARNAGRGLWGACP